MPKAKPANNFSWVEHSMSAAWHLERMLDLARDLDELRAVWTAYNAIMKGYRDDLLRAGWRKKEQRKSALIGSSTNAGIVNPVEETTENGLLS